MGREEQLKSFVQKIPIFEHLTGPLLEMLLNQVQFRTITKSGVICKKGSSSKQMYVVCSGSVGEFIEADNGVETIMKIRQVQDYFGELGMLAGESYITTAVALERTVVAEIPQEVFLRLVREDVSVNQYIMRMLIDRLRKSASWQMNFLYLDAPGKLAYTLIKLSAGKSNQEIAIHITQDDLANVCGLARQTVAKILGEWRKDEWIRTTRGKLIISNIDALLNIITSSQET